MTGGAETLVSERRGAGASVPGVAPAVQLWLVAVGVLLVGMIILGGLTRLTDSGLSITEWRPVTGTVPPLSEAAWLEEFEKYRRIPEYALVNRGMSLAAFKTIYWWEWSHRFLGRLIGIVFLIPLAYFWLRQRLPGWLAPRLAVLFVLGGAQGALGWYMVQSGLSERVDVSQYRLAAHLGLAFLIYAALVWTLFDARAGRPAPLGGLFWRRNPASLAVLGLVYLQILMGAFVAGLDAGLIYNTWPLMDGRLVPDGLTALAPWPRNLFENVTAVQFVHRMLAYLILAAVLALAWGPWRRGRAARPGASLVVAATLLQVVLGIATLLAVVPLPLAIAHQGGAVVLLTALIGFIHTEAAGRP